MSELDKTRIEFLKTELQTSFTLAGVAEAEHQQGDPENAARSLAHAEQGYSTLVRFLSDPKHSSHISQNDFQQLTAEVQRLRERLDSLRSIVES